MNTDSQYYNKEKSFFDTAYLSFFGRADTIFEAFFNRFYRLSFDKALKYIPKSALQNKIICEVGCNIARYLFYFKTLGARTAIGFDVSLGVLKRAMSIHHNYIKNIEVSPSKIHLVQSLAEQLPIPDNCIDTMFCFRSLHHFLHKDAFIEQCYRTLKDDGLLFIIEPSGSNPFRILANGIGKYFHYLTEGENACIPEETASMLAHYNFELLSIKYFNIFSEPNVHLGELSKRHSKPLYIFLSVLLIFTNVLDILLAPVVNKFFHKLSWSFIIVARKQASKR